ncbi:MAG: hypothetical protein AAGA06_12195 [Pseudomonadota bacterium]
MTKHVIDHPKTRDAKRMTREFSRIGAREHPSPQTRDLQKRTRKTGGGKRLKAFTDIERRSDS